MNDFNPNQAHYFETGSEVSEERIRKALAKDGISITQYRNPLPKMGGMIFTPFNIADIWELTTWKSKCDGSCQDRKKRHLDWSELSREQQQVFTHKVTVFMKNATFGYFRADRAFTEDPHLYDVELGDCRRTPATQ